MFFSVFTGNLEQELTQGTPRFTSKHNVKYEEYVSCEMCSNCVLICDLSYLDNPDIEDLLIRYSISTLCRKCIAKARTCQLCRCKYFASRANEANSLCSKCETSDVLHELMRVRSQNARTVISTLTLREWIDILNMYDRRCAYCGGEFHHLDHVIPVSRGGATTSKNCVPACKSCNIKKRDSVGIYTPSQQS